MIRVKTLVSEFGFSIVLLAALLESQQASAQDAATTELPPYASFHDGRLDKNSIPMSEAVLGLFVRVLSAEDSKPGGGVGVLTDWVGLDPVSADALFRYIRSSFDDTQRNSARLIESLCSRRNQVVNATTFAREIVEMESLHSMQLEANAAGIADVLGAEGAQKVVDWVDQNVRPTMTLISFDREAQITSGQVDVAAALATACDKPAAPTVGSGRN